MHYLAYGKGVIHMATKPVATKEAKPASKPAASKPAVTEGVTLKDLAKDLGREPKSVRAAIRRIKGGAQVGQGGRYSWTSKDSKEYKDLLAELKGKEKIEKAEVA